MRTDLIEHDAGPMKGGGCIMAIPAAIIALTWWGVLRLIGRR